MLRRSIALSGLALAACKGGDHGGEPAPPPPPATVRVVPGECADPSVTFEAGPRPRRARKLTDPAFDADDATRRSDDPVRLAGDLPLGLALDAWTTTWPAPPAVDGVGPGRIDNPLRNQPAVAGCLAQATPAAGALAIDLSYDEHGAVRAATVHGALDPAARRCLVEAAPRAIHRAPGAPAERCTLAYGKLSIADAYGLDVGETIALAGKPLAPLAAALTDDAPTFAPLAAALTAPAGDAAIVDRPPIVLRAAPTTPMRAIRRLLATAIAAHRDVVLATRTATGWYAFAPLELPTAPVPAGTGGNWGFTVRPLDAPGMRPHPIPRLLLRVEPTGVALSAIGAQARPDAHVALAQLAAALADRKATPGLAESPRVEIAARDDATYGDLMTAIEISRSHGFPHWKLVPVDKLTAD